MNKILGLILSILFIFEIFLFGAPLTTQATTLPPLGQGYAYYLSSYSSVAFVYNVSGITLSTANATALQNSFATDLNVYVTVELGPTYSPAQTFKLSIANYPGDVYFAYNPSTNKIEYVIILVNVIGSSSSSQIPSVTVPTTYIYQQLGIPSTLIITNNVQQFTQVQSLYSIPVIWEISNSQIESDIQNPSNTQNTGYFYEYVYGQLSSSITIGTTTISTTPTNTVLVFAPFSFQAPPFIPTPEAPGFFNQLQLSGALGPAMQSAASTKPYIWGRALLNTSIFDPFVSSGSGTDELTFQLNYSVPGTLQINMAQVGWVAAINNFPSKLTYSSYNFSTHYISFLGFIYTSNNITITINGVQVYSPESGEITINGQTYYVTLIAIDPTLFKYHLPNGTIVEFFNNLEVEYYTVSSTGQLQLSPYVPFMSTIDTGTEIPVYGYYDNPGSTITIQGSFNGMTSTITITIASSPTLTTYVAYTTLSATAYEGITASISGYYTTSPILSTPPSSITITGTTTFQDTGNLYSNYANASLTLLTNATLRFNKVPLETAPSTGFSFDGIIVTPAYPIINGTTAMQYMGTAQYTYVSGEYELLISGTQITMTSSTYTFNSIGYLTLTESAALPPFSNTLLSPSVPATVSGSGPLTLEFITIPQYAYITLVDFGIWSNETSVVVQAYSAAGQKLTVNKGYFYATIIPPRISTSKITPQSFECTNAPSVYIYDPDAILVPYSSTGSFTYASGSLIYNGNNEQGAIVFLGSTVYSVSGTFGMPSFIVTPMGTFEYMLEPMSGVNNQISAYQLALMLPNDNIIYPFNPTSSYAYLLQYYADNNPTVNFYFEQEGYQGGLNVSYNSMVLSPQNQIGYAWIYPKAIPNNASYNITNYVTFKVLSSYAPALVPYQSNTFITVTPNASFVGATDYYKYVSTDYAVYHYFLASKQYEVQTQITVPNITATLYFASAVTPLYASYAPLYFNESYYGASLPAYLALGTNGPLTWNAPNFEEFGVYATPLYLAKMLSVNVTLPSGTKYTILLTTNNITTLFVSLDAQQLQYCNGTYEFEISIPGLESILNLNAQQLNGSTLTVSVWDYVTHETLVASTKLVALSGLALIASQPGEVFYFLTFKASTTLLTASTPWFIATSMYKEPTLNLTDNEYAHINPTSILHLTVTNITVFHDGYKAMVYYNATSGRTIAINVYGKVVANYSGNLLPTIAETAAGSGMFNGTLPFVIVPNTTVSTITVNGITLYVNGTLGLQLANGSVVPLGSASFFVLPFITYQGVSIGYDANVSVSVTDPISSITVSTYLAPANITPIRLAPIPTIPPISKAPVGNYYYNKPVVITPTNPVINIYATSILPYPYEFFIIAIVRPGANASTAAPVYYYSYQAVVAKPALGSTLQPYIEVAVQMSGILSLPPGTYTVQMYAVPFAQGPVISEYPVSLIFTNVTIQ